MTGTQKPEAQNPTEGNGKQDCGTKAFYGLLIALTGLIASFLIAWIMLWFGMRTASDLVAVIGAFTSVTGTLTGYFFGQKIESAIRENTEKRLSASMTDLSLEKTKNTEITEKLYETKNENNLRSVCARDNDKLIEIAKGKILQWDKLRAEPEKRTEVPPENLLNEIRDLLNLAKNTEDVVKSLKIKDD